MIGNLLYLTASRPDISYIVGVCARYQANSKESHKNHKVCQNYYRLWCVVQQGHK